MFINWPADRYTMDQKSTLRNDNLNAAILGLADEIEQLDDRLDQAEALGDVSQTALNGKATLLLVQSLVLLNRRLENIEQFADTMMSLLRGAK